MNAAEVEIYDAVRQVQGALTGIRHTCIICKDYLSDWDVHRGYAICPKCRPAFLPAPRVLGTRRPLIVNLSVTAVTGKIYRGVRLTFPKPSRHPSVKF